MAGFRGGQCETRGRRSALGEGGPRDAKVTGGDSPGETPDGGLRQTWDSDRKPRTCDFLSFTYYWGKILWGGYALSGQTEGKTCRSALSAIGEWCQMNRPATMAKARGMPESEKVRGHDAFYGLRGNYRAPRVLSASQNPSGSQCAVITARSRASAKRPDASVARWAGSAFTRKVRRRALWAVTARVLRLPLARSVRPAAPAQLAWMLGA